MRRDSANFTLHLLIQIRLWATPTTSIFRRARSTTLECEGEQRVEWTVKGMHPKNITFLSKKINESWSKDLTTKSADVWVRIPASKPHTIFVFQNFNAVSESMDAGIFYIHGHRCTEWSCDRCWCNVALATVRYSGQHITYNVAQILLKLLGLYVIPTPWVNI